MTPQASVHLQRILEDDQALRSIAGEIMAEEYRDVEIARQLTTGLENVSFQRCNCQGDWCSHPMVHGLVHNGERLYKTKKPSTSEPLETA